MRLGRRIKIVWTQLLALFACIAHAAPAARSEPAAIVVIGDSVSAAYGFYPNNDYVADQWVRLGQCRSVDPPDDRCSNLAPGAAAPNEANTLNESPSGNGPWIAYSQQLGRMLNGARARLKKAPIPVHNYAVTGSCPAHWDVANIPGEQSNHAGVFASRSPQAHWTIDDLKENSLVILTLGANPLINRWMNIDAGVTDLIKGENVDCTRSIEAAMQCMVEDIEKNFFLRQHLVNIYTRLLLMKSDVLVQKYYRVCPWSFGLNDPALNVAGPSKGKPCDSLARSIASSLIDQVNKVIDEAVVIAQKKAAAKSVSNKIAAVCPGGQRQGPCTAWDNHLFGSDVPYVIVEDTGLHPNPTGHQHLAQGQLKALCAELGLFCAEQNQQEYYWPADIECSLKDYGTGIGRCIFVSLFNNTPHTLTLAKPDPRTPEEPTHGKWYLYPRESVPPGQTTQFMVPKIHLAIYGAEATVVYNIEGSQAMEVSGISAPAPPHQMKLHAEDPFNAWWHETLATATVNGPFKINIKPGTRADKTDVVILNAELTNGP